MLIVDPDKRAVTWLELAAERYRQSDDSRLIELTAAQLAGEIAWPG